MVKLANLDVPHKQGCGAPENAEANDKTNPAREMTKQESTKIKREKGKIVV